jgi:hypothetical protein
VMTRHWFALFARGLEETLRNWVRTLGDETIVSHPHLALTVARASAVSGDRESTERWLAIADRGTYEGPLPDGQARAVQGGPVDLMARRGGHRYCSPRTPRRRFPDRQGGSSQRNPEVRYLKPRFTEETFRKLFPAVHLEPRTGKDLDSASSLGPGL